MRQALYVIGVGFFLYLCGGAFPQTVPSSSSVSSAERSRPHEPSSSPTPPKLAASAKEVFRPFIPETWDDLRTFEVPLADETRSAQHVSWEYYYRVPWRPIYKSYPVYAPGHEPAGYLDWLKKQEPQVIWGIDVSGVSHKPSLQTKADWITAGGIVFDAPIAYDQDPWGTSVVGVEDVRDPAWYAATGTPVSADGIVPFAEYVIRRKGKVELGQQSCGMCHTRVMPDGTVVKGAQGNFPFERAAAWRLQKLEKQTEDKEALLEHVRVHLRASFDAPWLRPGPEPPLSGLSLEAIVETLAAIPAGVIARTGSGLFAPVQTPDLIGVKDRRFLDHTGLAQQRSIADFMRYAALNQDMNGLARYGDFVPEGIEFKTRPDPGSRSRYLDEQLYALALHVYSLQPPSNPNPIDALASQGEEIFEREGCVRCHTPPLYTNNMLIPVEGFASSDQIRKEFDILVVAVGTDPSLALRTRRGTGFYKVPSLRGLWYRGMFPHDGSCATLEDWFDPRRLRDDYTPTGFKGIGVETRAAKGHPFGLDLSKEDRKALIAFLKTL